MLVSEHSNRSTSTVSSGCNIYLIRAVVKEAKK